MLIVNLGIHEGKITHFQSEVEIRASGWLPCFSDLQLEPQHLSVGFYYLCYSIYVMCTAFIDFHMFKHFHISGVKTTWSLLIIFFKQHI